MVSAPQVQAPMSNKGKPRMQGVNRGVSHDPTQETTAIREKSSLQMLKVGKTLKSQKPLTAWFVRLWCKADETGLGKMATEELGSWGRRPSNLQQRGGITPTPTISHRPLGTPACHLPRSL